MKKTLLTVVALTGFAGSLFAGQTVYTDSKMSKEVVEEPEGGLYLGIFGGANVHQSADVSVSDDVSDAFGGLDTDYNSETGWFAGLKLGYVFPTTSTVKFALEIESFYNGVENSGIDLDGNLSDFGVDADFDGELEGDLHGWVSMLNAIVQFDLGTVKPYIGAGAGYAHVWIDDIAFNDVEVEGVDLGSFNADDSADDDSGTFAYQGIAGIDFEVSDRVDLFVEYKALVYHDLAVHDVGSLETYLNHLVGAGVKIRF